MRVLRLYKILEISEWLSFKKKNTLLGLSLTDPLDLFTCAKRNIC